MKHEDEIVSVKVLRAIMGYGNLVLPFVLIAIVALPFKEDKLQSTMSGYVYTAAEPAFIGALFSIAVIMVAYKGTNPRAGGIWKFRFSDRCVTLAIGLGAAMTAFFPAGYCKADKIAHDWTPFLGIEIGHIHALGAGLFFIAGGWLVLFHFPTSAARGFCGEADARYDRFYRFCGAGILFLAMLFVSIRMIIYPKDAVCAIENQLFPLFYIEALLTILFAAAWIVKSQTIDGVIRRALPPPDA